METQSLAADYGPMLDALSLEQALEAEIGPLTWTPRADAEPVTRHDGSRALRVAAVNAIGVRTSELELGASAPWSTACSPGSASRNSRR